MIVSISLKIEQRPKFFDTGRMWLYQNETKKYSIHNLYYTYKKPNNICLQSIEWLLKDAQGLEEDKQENPIKIIKFFLSFFFSGLKKNHR